MSFHSLEFGFFFALVVMVYYAVPSARRLPVLLGASLLFYLSFAAQNIFVLAGLIVAGYATGGLIERSSTQRVRKFWLGTALTIDLGMMAIFKYSPEVFGRSFGAIPVGLSFHTFQAMSYAIDIYRGRQQAERSFQIFALYIMFFPQIAAGPIERPRDMLPQFHKLNPFRYAEAIAGLQLMVWGIFQKYVVADHLALIVNSIYDSPDKLSGPVTAFGAVCFSFQIFCDFAGYSEIALGAAQVLGMRLTRNFDAPFHSDSMAEYWKRWHISLSNWMRDYVFFPLCGRRPRMPRICASIIVVFLTNALWHGARLHYLVSGLLHGTYRVTELLAGRAMSRAGWTVKAAWRGPVKVARTLLVFCLMTFAFLFFRGNSLGQSLSVAGRLLHGWSALFDPGAIVRGIQQTGLPIYTALEGIGLIAVVEAVVVLRSAGPLRPRIAALPFWWRWGLYYAGAAAALLLVPQTVAPFIYFAF
ncbi:MAG TPA: MBOAT family O-acyltransferase [Bryobacteraceae bacterium]|nr:MBOAT family O-acyltransferase [Bryobacteraceae bacterium]